MTPTGQQMRQRRVSLRDATLNAAGPRISSRHENTAGPTCAAPGCTNLLPEPGLGRPAQFCSQACRQRAWRTHQRQRGTLVAEVDMGSTSSKGRTQGRIWLVRLRRNNEKVIVAIGLHRAAADALADHINELL
jgi:hypothetical protein